jgi:hypothetical protein
MWLSHLDERLTIMGQNEIDQQTDAFISEVGRVGKKIAATLFEIVGEVAKAELDFAIAVASYSANHPSYVVPPLLRHTECTVLY